MRPTAEPTLIFDLTDVLIQGLEDVIRPLSDQLRVPPGDVLPALTGRSLVAFIEGRLSEAEYWQDVLGRTGWSTSAAALGAAVREAFGRPVAHMPEFLSSLGGHRLVLLSDQSREWMEWIEGVHPFLELFEQRFLSFEMGQTKRRVETFRRVLAELGTPPQECIFIDDLQPNVDRARSVGIRGITFVSAGELRGELESAGVCVGWSLSRN